MTNAAAAQHATPGGGGAGAGARVYSLALRSVHETKDNVRARSKRRQRGGDYVAA